MKIAFSLLIFPYLTFFIGTARFSVAQKGDEWGRHLHCKAGGEERTGFQISLSAGLYKERMR